MNGTKPGYKTTEFWLTLLSNAATALGTAQGHIPQPYGLYALIAINSLYMIMRTVSKAVADVQTAKTKVAETTGVIVGEKTATVTAEVS